MKALQIPKLHTSTTVALLLCLAAFALSLIVLGLLRVEADLSVNVQVGQSVPEATVEPVGSQFTPATSIPGPVLEDESELGVSTDIAPVISTVLDLLGLKEVPAP